MRFPRSVELRSRSAARTSSDTRNFNDDARDHDQNRREDENDQRVLHERGAGVRRAVCERKRERDDVTRARPSDRRADVIGTSTGRSRCCRRTGQSVVRSLPTRAGAPTITMRGRQSGTTARRRVLVVLALALVGCAMARRLRRLAAAPDQPALVTLSIVGTSDLHGAAFPRNGIGGLPLLAGYVNNLRAARASDGGAVLLIDSGDTFQGDVESNLGEGALVVDAYNAMGYAAEAIGNHDFDFGSVDSAAARQLPGDL